MLDFPVSTPQTNVGSAEQGKKEPNPSAKSKSKSRNGCLTCKNRRLKCDETKPSCLNCLKKKIKCGGYATRFKWRSFNEGKESAEADFPQNNTPNKRPRSSFLSTSANPTPMSNSSSVRSDLSPWLETSLSRGHSICSNTPQDVITTPTEHLLLKEHLELTSMSVLGKSTKLIQLENDLLAKGINPETYFDRRSGVKASKKMRRSYSSNEISGRQSSLSLQRSYSASSPQMMPEVANFRNEFRSLSGLQSLAEAAVDTMRTTPTEPSPMYSGSEQLSARPAQFSNKHQHSPVFTELQPSPSSTSIASPRRISEISPPPNEWQMQRTFQHLPGIMGSPAAQDAFSDLNLTPSLSALFNFVFTNPEHAKDSILLGNPEMPDSALSPLDLATASTSQYGVDTPLVARDKSKEDANSQNEEKTSPLLSDVRKQLIKHNPFPSSIVSTSSNDSLLRTSEQQQILYLYSTYTCKIMSIQSGVTENPWRNIYLPLAVEYSYLFNSIAAMTLFHLAGNAKLREQSLSLRAKGCLYMKKCILELATGLSRLENGNISDDHLPADVALATCLNLAVSESWDTHTSSGIAHLKGAKSMIQKVLSIITQFSSRSRKKNRDMSRDKGFMKKLVLVTDDEWRKMSEYDNQVDHCDALLGPLSGLYIPKNIQLLFNEWIYFEVLSQMTTHSGHDDKGIDLVATITKAIQTNQKKRNKELNESKSQDQEASPTDSARLGASDGFRQGFAFFENLDTMLQNKDNVDPLLGCAQSLFLIMGKVANLISKIRKTQNGDRRPSRNSLSNILIASELKRQLTDWKPNVKTNLTGMMSDESKDPTWDIYSCVSTAEAYRYATLLYLHEAVPEVPLLSSHQLAEKVFVLLASIPSTSNLYTVHIFPLLVSSSEARPGEEREWCEARWGMLIERIWIGNIDRAFEVVKEVWRRKDEYDRNLKRDTPEKKSDTSLDFDDPQDISAHLQEVVEAMRCKPSTDERGITSKLHWSSVMREWGWEVLLA